MTLYTVGSFDILFLSGSNKIESSVLMSMSLVKQPCDVFNYRPYLCLIIRQLCIYIYNSEWRQNECSCNVEPLYKTCVSTNVWNAGLLLWFAPSENTVTTFAVNLHPPPPVYSESVRCVRRCKLNASKKSKRIMIRSAAVAVAATKIFTTTNLCSFLSMSWLSSRIDRINCIGHWAYSSEEQTRHQRNTRPFRV